MLTEEIEVGKIYRGKVVTIKEFGCFVEVLPGKDGLCHISELANFRVKQTEDIVKVGDDILVKCLGVDEKGRVRLSRKAAMAERDQEMSGQPGGSDGHPARAQSRYRCRLGARTGLNLPNPISCRGGESGRANSGAFAIYASTLGSRVPIYFGRGAPIGSSLVT